MKTIIVTGSNGLLGQKITEKILQEGGVCLVATGKGVNRYPKKKGYVYEEMDVLQPASVDRIVTKYHPDAIIHTAALTNVDACETAREEAYALNVTAVEILIAICQQKGIHLVHLSTDFVFDGSEGPYEETAAPHPLSYYGETKLSAERLILNSKVKAAILRTIIVYGIVNDMSRSNIVLWAKGALEKGQPINVVNDQWRMPTLAEDLADACLLAVAKEAEGIFHISGKDMMSIAELVYRVADYWKLDKALVREVSSDTFKQPARRPAKTGFVLDKAMTELNYHPHSFEEGLAVVDQQLQNREIVK